MEIIPWGVIFTNKIVLMMDINTIVKIVVKFLLKNIIRKNCEQLIKL